MSGFLQPLDQKFAIVDKFGNPTEYFIRWAQQRQIDIGDSITLADLQTYLDAHVIVAGTGIQFAPGPNGDLNSNPTIHADAQAILDEITATRGAVLYRGLLGWAGLLPGTAGFVLSTNGAGADPSWAAAGGGGGGSTPTIRNTAFYSYNAASYNVVFPVGSAVGDVMVVFWENGFNGITGGPAGWTNLSIRNDGFTNGATIAKVMTAGDIAAGFVTVTAGGSFNGVAAAVCLVGSTVAGYRDKTDFASAGSTSVATSAISQLFNATTADLIFGMISTRGAMNIGVSAGLTILSNINAVNASGVLVTYNAALLGKLGIAETATYPVGNNGTYWCMTAFKGP